MKIGTKVRHIGDGFHEVNGRTGKVFAGLNCNGLINVRYGEETSDGEYFFFFPGELVSAEPALTQLAEVAE